jgi:hypothetical protein
MLTAPIVSSAAPLQAAGVDDIVFLKNGGRARGLVLESDPRSGARLRLEDGTLRWYDANAIDHIEYGSTTSSPTPLAPGSQLVTIGDRSSGALRIESSEPGDLVLDGGDFGTTPQLIERLAPGPHRVIIRFHAGDSNARLVTLRAGVETPIRFETPATLRAFRARQGISLGIGVEGGTGLVDFKERAAGIRGVVRANWALSRVFELRADARFGLFPACHTWFEKPPGDGYPSQYHDKGAFLGFGVRADAQINWGSVYTLSAGVDAVYIGYEGMVAGGHVSPLGFRFGYARQLLLSFQAGLLSGHEPVLDFTGGLTYLFL